MTVVEASAFPFFCGCRFGQEAKNRISTKIKNVAELSKVSAEDSKQLGKIENCGRKFKSSAERWALRRKFEIAAEQLKSPAKN